MGVVFKQQLLLLYSEGLRKVMLSVANNGILNFQRESNTLGPKIKV